MSNMTLDSGINSYNNISNLSTPSYDDAYSAHLQELMTLMNKIYPLPLCILGTVGNIFIFLIYTKTPSLRRISTSFYIRAQTLADTLLIYLGALRYFILGVANINIKDSSIFMCKSLNYTIFVLSFTAAWLLVLSSIDRLVFVFHYNKLLFMLQRRVQIFIVVMIPLAGLLVYVWHPISYGFIVDLITHQASCTELDMTYKRILYLLELVFIVLLPFLLLTLSSMLLTVALKNSCSSKLDTIREDGTVQSFHKAIRSSIRLYEQHRIQKSSLPFTFTLLTLNFFFLAFLIPHTLINIYKTYKNINTTEVNFYYTIATIIRYSYFSFSFLAHYCSNRIFREHFLILTGLRGLMHSHV